MLSNENINDIIKAARGTSDTANERDLAFLVLCDMYADKDAAFKVVYPERGGVTAAEYMTTDRIKAVLTAARPFGVGVEKGSSVSREENQEQLVRMLARIESAMDDGDIEPAQGLKMMADIRVKLQDKFDMDQSDDSQKHIIVVPQKHDYICPHTNRECSKMPSKDACMAYYGLSDGGSSKNGIVGCRK